MLCASEIPQGEKQVTDVYRNKQFNSSSKKKKRPFINKWLLVNSFAASVINDNQTSCPPEITVESFNCTNQTCDFMHVSFWIRPVTVWHQCINNALN